MYICLQYVQGGPYVFGQFLKVGVASKWVKARLQKLLCFLSMLMAKNSEVSGHNWELIYNYQTSLNLFKICNQTKSLFSKQVQTCSKDVFKPKHCITIFRHVVQENTQWIWWLPCGVFPAAFALRASALRRRPCGCNPAGAALRGRPCGGGPVVAALW